MDASPSEFAQRLNVAIADLARMVERMDQRQWRSISREEGWPVGSIVNHVCLALLFHADIVLRLASGREPRALTMVDVHEINRSNAELEPAVSREEALDQLSRHGQRASRIIQRLSPEQLQRSAAIPLLDGQVYTTLEFIETAVIGHVEAHTRSVRATLAGAA